MLITLKKEKETRQKKINVHKYPLRRVFKKKREGKEVLVLIYAT